jgi:alkylation response protein AidB-like acyl-CoA dehydrogenase
LLTASARADIAQRAHALDTQAELASTVLPMLAHHDLLRMGLPAAQGGHGGDVRDAMAAITEVASLSLTAAFVFWSQRAFIHYLQASSNEAARERWWDALLRGDIAGAVGLSNVIKFLCRPGRWRRAGAWMACCPGCPTCEPRALWWPLRCSPKGAACRW